jgi:hypothetical protein
MGIVESSDVRRLLQNPELMSDIASAVAEDPSALDDLAEDIADEMEDELENDPEFRRRIIDAAMGSPDFKKKVVRKLVGDLG